jgi:hypothetical protein
MADEEKKKVRAPRKQYIPTFIGTEAAGRFTHTPITIKQVEPWREPTGLETPYEPNALDAWLHRKVDPSMHRISMEIPSGETIGYTQEDPYRVLQKLSTHEQVHAALEPLMTTKGPQDYSWLQRFADQQGNIYNYLAGAMRVGNRAGYQPFEVPAYSMAYDPDQLRGLVSSEMSEKYNRNLIDAVQKIRPDIAKMLSGLAKTYRYGGEPEE